MLRTAVGDLPPFSLSIRSGNPGEWLCCISLKIGLEINHAFGAAQQSHAGACPEIEKHQNVRISL